MPHTSHMTLAKRALIIDDNTIAADGLAKLLILFGWDAVSAYSADDARSALVEPVDIILLDLGMADMDGYEFITMLRTEMGLTIPIVALTGHGLEEDKRKTYSAGFDAHITKPVGGKELHEALITLLNT